MTLYLYKVGNGIPDVAIENVASFTADMVLTSDGGIYSPLAEGWELSSLPDCSEALRADWRSKNLTTDARIAVLEEQLAQSDETAIALYEAQEEQEVINDQQDEALMEIYEMIG